jgi:hypothetical protein
LSSRVLTDRIITLERGLTKLIPLFNACGETRPNKSTTPTYPAGTILIILKVMPITKPITVETIIGFIEPVLDVWVKTTPIIKPKTRIIKNGIVVSF